MPRRNRPPRRPVMPDPRYQSALVTRLMHRIMHSGKKSVAERIVYSAFDRVESESGRRGVDVFEQAVRNASPVLEVKPRRVGGATYQVPIDVRPDRRLSLSLRWLVDGARRRSGRSMAEKLSAELMDAANNAGAAVRRKEEVHRMAEANRAFVHYRW